MIVLLKSQRKFLQWLLDNYSNFMYDSERELIETTISNKSYSIMEIKELNHILKTNKETYYDYKKNKMKKDLAI